MGRKYIDCRELPSENSCDLAMSGSEEHLVEAAALHAIAAQASGQPGAARADPTDDEGRDPRGSRLERRLRWLDSK